MQTLLQVVKFGIRMLAKNPGTQGRPAYRRQRCIGEGPMVIAQQPIL